jgi:transketolase
MPRSKNSDTAKLLSYCATDEIANIEKASVKIREDVIRMLLEAGSGHSAGSLGTADIFASLYFKILNINPEKPEDPDRDRFILSNGHICPVWYATLAHRGYFHKHDLKKLRKLGSTLQGHPHNLSAPGIENSSGSLGQGLSQAVGMALAAKMDKKKYFVYCMTGDGELDEGQNWEAAMFASAHKIDNLIWIVDRNNIQQDGYTEDVLPLEPLRDKLEAFGWYVIEIDGHNVEEIINSCNMAKTILERPVVIIAHTIAGHGVDFMEYKFEWHGKPPNKKEAKNALTQLRTLEGKIECYDHN